MTVIESVSILVVLETGPQPPTTAPLVVGTRVSILVVLETGPQHYWRVLRMDQQIRFQSLLFWKLVLNPQILFAGTDVDRFQSLLFWKLVLNDEGFATVLDELMFQSLLFWKLVLNS